MGVASYSRGNAVIRRQTRADLAATRLVQVDGEYLATVERQREEAMAEVSALRAELSRTQSHLRERRATITAERLSWIDERHGLVSRLRDAHRAMIRYRRCWEYTSRLLRQIPPRDVQSARESLTPYKETR